MEFTIVYASVTFFAMWILLAFLFLIGILLTLGYISGVIHFFLEERMTDTIQHKQTSLQRYDIMYDWEVTPDIPHLDNLKDSVKALNKHLYCRNTIQYREQICEKAFPQFEFKDTVKNKITRLCKKFMLY